MSSFPSSKFDRTKIVTKTGLKVGGNYAKYHLNRLIGKNNDSSTHHLHTKNATDIYKAFSQLRGTALKIAQAISIDNSGMLPDEFIATMTQAQYSVPPLSPIIVQSIFKQQFGKRPQAIFSQFYDTAIAAASIGQVHLAEHPDYGKLAVKVQYPNIRETIDSDLVIAKTLFKRLIKSDKTDIYFEEIRDRLLEETDYLLEGKHISYFKPRYENKLIVIPDWIEPLSSHSILTMTYLEGDHLKDFLDKHPSQDERNHFGQLLWDFFHNQINTDRTIHADAHPGNYKFRADGSLIVLDFGCVKSFPKTFFYNYMRALPLQIRDNEDELLELYHSLEIIPDIHNTSLRVSNYFNFFREFGNDFIRPYREGTFDFSDDDFKTTLSNHLKNATSFKEPVGSRHFIYSSRVHMGLYSILMQLKATIETEHTLNQVISFLDSQNSM